MIKTCKGLAAVNINGSTIHFCLGAGIDRAFCPFSGKQHVLLQNKLSEIKFITPHEISMVSSVLLFSLNDRLNNIFGCDSQKVFAGLPVVACGDIYQFPSVNGAPIYSTNPTMKG